MGFLQNKSDLMGEISTARAISENFPKINNSVNTTKSVKSSNGDILPFLLDILQEVSGKTVKSVLFGDEYFRSSNELTPLNSSNFVQNGGIFSKVGEVEDLAKNSFIDYTVSTFFKDEDPLIGDLLTPNDDTLLETEIKNIDITEQLKINPNSDSGSFFYGVIDESDIIQTNSTVTVPSNTKSLDFKQFLSKVIELGDGEFINLLSFNYDNQTEVLTVLATPETKNLKVKTFLSILLNKVQILDLRLLSLELLNVVYGTTASVTGIGKEYLLDQIKFKKYIDKLTDKLSLEENNEISIIDDGFFVFNKSEIDEINSKTENILNGINASNLGCSFGENFIDFGDLLIFSNTNKDTDYPYFMENNISSDLFSLVDSSAQIGSGEENKDSVSNNIFGEMLNNLLSVIIKFFTLNPIIVLIKQIFSRFISGVVKTYGAVKSFVNRPIDEIVKDSVSWLKCIWKTIYSWIMEFIFNLIKPEILRLVAVLTAKIIDEKTKNKFKLAQRTRELLVNVDNILSFIRTIRS